MPSLTALQLQREYEANEIAADQKYQRKWVIVTGTVDSIDATITGAPSLRLRGTRYLNWVRGDLNRDLKDDAAQLKKGDKVTLRCRVAGFSLGIVGMDDCKFVCPQTGKNTIQTKNLECYYYGSGKLQSEVPLKNGKQEGMGKLYYESGALLGEGYGKNGKLEGLVKAYYASGALLVEVPFKNGELEGLAKAYYENGTLLAEVPFKDNELKGLVKAYYENGALLAELSGKISEQEGLAKTYRNNGQPLVTFESKKGAPIRGICHHSDGTKTDFTKANLTNFSNGINADLTNFSNGIKADPTKFLNEINADPTNITNIINKLINILINNLNVECE